MPEIEDDSMSAQDSQVTGRLAGRRSKYGMGAAVSCLSALVTAVAGAAENGHIWGSAVSWPKVDTEGKNHRGK